MLFPNVAITLTEQNVREMEENVQTDQLDLAFVMIKTSLLPAILTMYTSARNGTVLGIPRKHPMAQYAAPTGKPLNTMDLKHFKMIPLPSCSPVPLCETSLIRCLRISGYLPKIRYETHMNNVLYRLVSNGLLHHYATVLCTNGSGSVWFYPEPGTILGLVYHLLQRSYADLSGRVPDPTFLRIMHRK